MPRKPVKNGFQRRQFQRGERRLRGDEVKHYLALADSDNPKERLEAMQNLCPCHVRKRVDAAWDALYRGLQDSDLKVRQAAWHTLEENHGGRRDDPKLYPIMVEIAETEVNPKLRQNANDIVKKAQTIEEKKQSIRGDIEKLEQSIAQIGEQQKQLQANLYALHGALQQCDQFLELLQEEENEKDG